jgi:hypothetical protein
MPWINLTKGYRTEVDEEFFDLARSVHGLFHDFPIFV